MRVAHLADVHLDASFALFRRDVGRRRRQAIEATLSEAVRWSANENVDAFLIAGDLYEHDRVSPDTGGLLRALFSEIAPTPILISPGNHDWYGPKSLFARLDWPSNVHVFTGDRLKPYELEDGLTLWGAGHLAPANTDNFLDGFHVEGGGTHVALFHGSEQSALMFQEEGKVPHAPFRAEQIAEAGLSHAFCGHYHTPADHPLYTYPGNPEPLTFGESDKLVRGLVLATIRDDGSVERERVHVAQTDVEDVVLDVTGCASGNEIREHARSELEGRSGCVRLTVEGELEPAVDLRLEDLDQVAPWLDAVAVRAGGISVAYDLDAIRVEPTVRGAFVKDVFDATLEEDEKRKIVVTGLRALEGRGDLEVV